MKIGEEEELEREKVRGEGEERGFERDRETIRSSALQDQTLLPSLPILLRQESSASGVFEHLTDALVGLGGTFEVFVGADLLANFLALFRSDRLLRGLVQLLDRLLVVSEILLTSNKDDRKVVAEMENFGDPL